MVVRIRSGRHPHEVALLLAALVLGVAGALFFDTVASATVRTLPGSFGPVLYAALAVGSAISLTGVFWPGVTGALIERAGLIGLIGLSFCYAGMILVVNGWRGTAFTVFLTAFGLANLFRAFQISREIRELTAARVFLEEGEAT